MLPARHDDDDDISKKFAQDNIYESINLDICNHTLSTPGDL